MKKPSAHPLFVHARLALAVAIIGAAAARAEEEPATTTRRPGSVDFARQRLAADELIVADSSRRRCEFVAEPLMTFENPASQILDGLLFAWTDRGRPVALVKSYYNVSRES